DKYDRTVWVLEGDIIELRIARCTLDAGRSARDEFREVGVVIQFQQVLDFQVFRMKAKGCDRGGKRAVIRAAFFIEDGDPGVIAAGPVAQAFDNIVSTVNGKNGAFGEMDRFLRKFFMENGHAIWLAFVMMKSHAVHKVRRA